MDIDTSPGGRALDRRALVWGVLVIAFGLLGWGELRADHPYSSSDFVVAYFWTELQVTALVLVATVVLGCRERLGLRWPQAPARWRHLLPLLLLVAAAVAARHWTTLQATEGPRPDVAGSWMILRTTLLVGLNEEWLFRGLALAAFCRWWGWRRGWMAALVAFGCLHLLNLIAGVPLVGAAFQFMNTMLVGSVFLLAAVATRSLLLPMAGHALYDWAVIDAARYLQAGALPTASLLLPLFGLALGICCLWALWHLPQQRPYP